LSIKKRRINPFLFAKTESEFDFFDCYPNYWNNGTETTFVSSPTDLIESPMPEQITRLLSEEKIESSFMTATSGSIYGHSKAICDF
jgi:hypothetical protein